MNEIILVVGVIFFIGAYYYREQLLQYVRDYHIEFKKAYKGELKDPSPLEIVSFGKQNLIKYGWVVVCIVMGIISWGYMRWWSLAFASLLYFSFGALFLYKGWMK